MNQRWFEVFAAYKIWRKKTQITGLVKNCSRMFLKRCIGLVYWTIKVQKWAQRFCSIENSEIYGSWNWNYKSKFGCNHTLHNDCHIAKEILFKSTCKSFALVANQSIMEGGCQVQCERVLSITQQTCNL